MVLNPEIGVLFYQLSKKTDKYEAISDFIIPIKNGIIINSYEISTLLVYTSDNFQIHEFLIDIYAKKYYEANILYVNKAI